MPLTGFRKAPLGAFFSALLGALLVCELPLAQADPSSDLPPGAAIASAHPMATEAGLEILAAGGNAFDAAVAVSAALAVVEPYSSGLGGGGFWLMQQAGSAQAVFLDGRETAPAAAHRDLYLDEQGGVRPGASIDGPLSAAIPGLPAALVNISSRYGRLPLAHSLTPAMRLARDGFEVTPLYRRLARFRLAAIQASPTASRVLLDNGRLPALGHRIIQPQLAVTLERLARRGFDGFYRGATAHALVNAVRNAGGIWTLKDLANYRVRERQPLTARYRELDLILAPPPSSGGIALATALNILAGHELGALSEVERIHLVVEAMRRAYRDRAEYLGDPDFHPVPVARLMGMPHADALALSIDPERATPSSELPPARVEPEGPHTTHLSILDAEGSRVAATLTVNYPFGSGFMAAGTGVLLNDEMDDFSAKPGVPNAYGLVGGEANAIAPGKRPLSSMSPSFADGPRSSAILGTPGGSRIISMVLLALLDMAEGRGARDWVSRPRYHHQYLPDLIQHEPDALDESQRRQLQAKGHRLHDTGQRYGNMQAIYWDRQGKTLEAASDPRGEGVARVVPAMPTLVRGQP